MIELLLVILTGLAFGSFVTMASYRLPLDEDIVKKPSRCPKCETPLGFRDLWPVLSWVMSGAKCRHCSKKIPARYPLTELATAAMFALVYAFYGVSPLGIVLMLMAVVLLIMIVADLEHFIIPDQIHYALLPLGIVFHYLKGTDWIDVAVGCAFGAGLGLLLHYGYRWLRKKDGLGFGDVKFLGVAGLWLTFPLFPAFLFASGLLGVATGLVYRALGKGPYFPFGPALALALFFCVAFPGYFNIVALTEAFSPNH